MNKLYKLTDVCDFQGGTQPPKSEWLFSKEDGYIRMLQIRDFTRNNVKSEYVKDSSKLKKCKSDDILIARYGASVGKILTGKNGAYNVALMKTLPSKKLEKKYLYYYLNSEYFQKRIKNVGSRAAQAGFNKDDLSTLDIFLPTIEIQKKIIFILDLAQSLIEKRKEQLVEMDRLIQSYYFKVISENTTKKILLKEIIQNILTGKSYSSQEDSVYKVLKTSSVSYDVFKPKEFKNLPATWINVNKVDTKRANT